MKLSAAFQYSGRSSLSAKNLGAAFKSANEATVEYWHSTFLPLHFQPSAAARYAYQKRSGEGEPANVPRMRGIGPFKRQVGWKPNPKYYWQKKRKGFGTTALVRTGASREATRSMKVTSSTKQAVGSFPLLPRYFYQYRKDNKDGRTPIDKAAELIALLESELNILGGVHEKATAAFLEKLNTANRETVIYAA